MSACSRRRRHWRRPEPCVPCFSAATPCRGASIRRLAHATGTVPDLTRELAKRLGVPVSIVSAPNAGAVIGALRDGKADIGFLAYDAERGREVDFGPAFVVMANSYLVKATSPIKASADVDREGVTVAAVKGQTQEHFVSSRHDTRARPGSRRHASTSRGRHAPDQWRRARIRHQSAARARG